MGWHLAVGAFFVGLALTIVLAGPLGRVIPPRLEPYEAPFWKLPKADKYGRLFLDERTDSDGQKQTDDSRPD